MLIENIILIFSLLFFLLIGVRFLIDNLLKIASYLKVSNFFISFLIAGVATSLPELMLGIQSSLFKTNQISLGNILGANINDLSFILAVSILLAYLSGGGSLKIVHNLNFLNFVKIFLIALYPFLLALDGYLSFIDAIFILLVFIGYLYFSFKENLLTLNLEKETNFKEFFNSILYCFFSILIIIFSSFLVIKESKELVEIYNLNKIPFGALILSISSTIPELLFTYQSIRKKIADFAIGNIFGSVAFNSNFILAINSILNPFKIEEKNILVVNLIFLILIFLIDWHFLRSKEIKMGIPLFLLSYWLLFLIVNFLFLI